MLSCHGVVLCRQNYSCALMFSSIPKMPPIGHLWVPAFPIVVVLLSDGDGLSRVSTWSCSMSSDRPYHSCGHRLGHSAGDRGGVGLCHGGSGGVGDSLGRGDGAVDGHSISLAPLTPFVVPRSDSGGRGEACESEDVEQLHGYNKVVCSEGLLLGYSECLVVSEDIILFSLGQEQGPTL